MPNIYTYKYMSICVCVCVYKTPKPNMILSSQACLPYLHTQTHTCRDIFPQSRNPQVNPPVTSDRVLSCSSQILNLPGNLFIHSLYNYFTHFKITKDDLFLLLHIWSKTVKPIWKLREDQDYVTFPFYPLPSAHLLTSSRALSKYSINQ